MLPIKGLPKTGVNYLFAGAVKFPILYPHIENYIKLAQKEDEWYNNLEGEDCAMPATFAVFALGLESPQYFNLVIRYLQISDHPKLVWVLKSVNRNWTKALSEKKHPN